MSKPPATTSRECAAQPAVGDGGVAGAGPDTAPGICCECGQRTDHGRVLGHVDQGSGAGWTVLICSVCDLRPKSRPGR